MKSQSNEARSLVHQQQLLVIGFIGGIVFTALVLVLQDRGTFEVAIGPLSAGEYFDLLIVLIAGTSSVCIFGSFALTGLAAGRVPSVQLRKLAVACFVLGMLGLLVILPMLLLIFTLAGAGVVSAFEVFLAFVFLRSFGGSYESTPS